MNAQLHPDTLQAVARTRAQGLHFWGRILGITAPPHGASAADPTGPMILTASAADVTTVATLSDVGLGSALRAHHVAEGGGVLRLATTSLAIQHAGSTTGTTDTVSRPITCTSGVSWIDPAGSRALMSATVSDDSGRLVASAQGWMAMLPVAPGTAVIPMPWEVQAVDVEELAPGDLTEAEYAAADLGTQALARAAASGLPLAEELLGVSWTTDEDAKVLIGTLSTGPHLGNRVGNVQGGSLYGLAATAAARLAGPEHQLSDGSMQFLRPGTGGELRVTATMLRRGRTISFVDTTIEQGGVLITSAHFTLMGAR